MTQHQIVAVAVSLAILFGRTALISEKSDLSTWFLWLLGGYWFTVWVSGHVWTGVGVYDWIASWM